MSPFDYINSINFTKANLIVDEKTEKDYLPFIVNRGLGYFADTVLLANEMNLNGQLDKKLQYDFLRTTVKKKKRFSKWLKNKDDAKLDIIKEYYGYSTSIAKQVLPLFEDAQIKEMKKKLDKGGSSKK